MDYMRFHSETKSRYTDLRLNQPDMIERRISNIIVIFVGDDAKHHDDESVAQLGNSFRARAPASRPSKSGSTQNPPMATKEDQETLRLLVQYVSRAFYEPKYTIIMDQLARHTV